MRRLVAVAALAAALAVSGCRSAEDFAGACNLRVGGLGDAAVQQCAEAEAAAVNQRTAETWAGLLLLPVAILSAGAAYAPPVYTCSTYGRPGGGPGGYRTTTTCY